MCVFFVCCSIPVLGEPCAGRLPLDGFAHLRALVGESPEPFDPEKIRLLLDHVDSDGFAEEPLFRGGLDRAASAYHAFEFRSDMARLIRYCYNPRIPSCAVMPSMIRLSAWKSLHDLSAPSELAHLERRLPGLVEPVVIRSVYYMQNTPDPHTGAYYGYDSYRTVILMPYKGRRVLLSILKQKDVSDVGRKGYILGREQELDFFYSGEKGLTARGLGWVKSYVYDSFSVSVYMESPGSADRLRCATFKWLRAGWAGKNMAGDHHVHQGLLRFAEMFRQVMEADDFPSPDQLADICTGYTGLSDSELKSKMEEYLAFLQGKCASLSGCPRYLRSAEAAARYVDSLSPMEMSATLIVDHVKHMITRDEKTGDVALGPSGLSDGVVF
ncbi:hypothetical protein [Desulfatiferula olefinivorans]